MNLVLLRNIYRNLGDEAMLACEIDLLRKEFPQAELTVLTDEPTRVAEQYQVSAAHSDITFLNPFPSDASRRMETGLSQLPLLGSLGRKLRNRFALPLSRFVSSPARELFEQHLHRADVLITGGAMIPSVPHVERVRAQVLSLLASVGKPIVLHGQSIYRENDPAAPFLQASCLITRDHSRSRLRAESCGLPPSRILDGVDPALLLEPTSGPRVSNFLATHQLIPKTFAVLTLRSGLSPKTLAKIRSALNLAHDHYEFDRLLLAGMQVHPSENDHRLLKSFAQTIPKIPCSIHSGYTDPRLFKAILGASSFVIATRYHAAVFALSSLTPVFAFSHSAEYDLKLEGIYQQFDAPAWFHTHQTNTPFDIASSLPLYSPTHLQLRLAALKPKADLLPTWIRSTIGDNHAPH